ncbi:MAG: hypothetical protein PHH85_03455 [Candidatus Methanoperedens sp.]|nr:hypothetical protein [Candidatus Methanoperedens sp.]
METAITDLKVYRCLCKTPMRIKAHRDGMFILRCNRCGYEVDFLEDHPYFNHEEARTEIGDYVIFEAFKKRG